MASPSSQKHDKANRLQGKARTSSGLGSGTGAKLGFGAFSAAANASSLSYLSEPPNLTEISDPNVVVSFKNLSKKDGITKAKAL